MTMSQDEIEIPMEITDEGQILGALDGNASTAQREGAEWMLTEFVENGIDAIKQNKRSESEGGTGFTDKGTVMIEIDTVKQEVRIIDNGTGILDPWWVASKPFKSVKKGIDYQIGNYGRGITGYRGFCNNLTFISLRNKPNLYEISKLSVGQTGRCVRLRFNRDKAVGRYLAVDEADFKKYCDFKIGSIAILSDWRSNEFEKFIQKRNTLELRLQHHFGMALKSDNIEIIVKRNKISQKIEARDYSDYAPFEIPDLEVKNIHTNKTYGIIKFHLFQTTPQDKYEYKAPFLLINGRPLQKSFLHEMDAFENQQVWTSPYLTGYIEADFLTPNQLRIAIESIEDEKKYFEQAVISVGVTLTGMVSDYINALTKDKMEKENERIAIDLQKFMRKMKIELDFTSFKELGNLTDDNGSDRSSDRISAVEGKENDGLIVDDGTEEVIIQYGQDKRTKKGTPLTPIVLDSDTGKKGSVTTGLPEKDGKNQKIVWVHPEKSSVGGRKRKTILKGPGLTQSYEDLIKEELSWYEPTVQKVIINSGSAVYAKLEKKAKRSTSAESVYDKKVKNYIRTRYLWEIIMRFCKEQSREEKEKIFWKVFHNYFATKDTE